MMPRLTLRELTRMLRDQFSPRSAAALASIVILAAASGVAHAEWFAGAEIRGVFDDNVNLSADYGEMKSDASLQSSVSLGHYFHLAGSTATALSISAEAKHSDFARFSGLDNLESGLAASLRYKRGLGSYAPWIKIFGSAKYADFREDFRDGDAIRSGLLLGKRLYERVFTQIGYEYDMFSARNSLFDTRNSVVSARIEFLLTETMQAWVGYAQSRGIYLLYLTGFTIPGAVRVDTFGEPANVVRVQATTQALSAGASKALGSHWSAEISVDFADVYSSARGRHYPDTIYRAGIIYAY